MTPNAPGRFFVVEGVDGSGKTSLLARLPDLLSRETGRVVTLGEDAFSRTLRTSIKEVDLPPHAELLLFSAERRYLVDELIRPALERGEIVVTDRWVLSTYVYQGLRGVTDAEIASATHLATDGRSPDLSVVLDIPATEQRLRMEGRGGPEDRFERQGLRERVRRAYRTRAASLPNCEIVSAMGSPDNVLARVMDRLRPHLTADRPPVRRGGRR